MIEFWKNRTYWQKGALSGLILGFLSYLGPLVYTIITSQVSIPKPSILMIGYILLSILILSGVAGVFFGIFGFLVGIIKKEESETEIDKIPEQRGLEEFFKPNKKKIANTVLLLFISVIYLMIYTAFNFETAFLFSPLLLFYLLPIPVLIIFVLLAYIFSCYIIESKKLIRGIIFYSIIFIIIFTITPFSTTSRNCDSHSDCANRYCCGCMNKHSVCGTTLPWRDYHVTCTANFGSCSCIDNVCREVYYENFNTVEECYELNNVDACISNLASRNEDIEICESIEDINIKIKCKEELIKEEDITKEFCNLYTDIGNKNMCLRKLAERLNDLSLCYEMEPERAKESCLVGLGFLTSPEDCEKLKEYKTNCYYKLAENSNDTTFCDKIDTELHRDSCITKFAQSINDCDRIESDWMKKDCISKFSPSLKAECEGINEKYAELECYFNLALKLKDINLCDEVEDIELRGLCVLEFVASLNSVEECEKTGGAETACYNYFSKKLNDPEICHKISPELFERLCLVEFVADAEECKAFGGEDSRSRCYYKIAWETKGLSLCDKVEAEDWKNACIERISNVESCETMEGSYKDSCYYSSAIRIRYYGSGISWGDKSLCNKIEYDESLKNRCIGIIASEEKCASIKDRYQRYECYYDAAINFRFQSFCEKIINAKLRLDCHAAF